MAKHISREDKLATIASKILLLVFRGKEFFTDPPTTINTINKATRYTIKKEIIRKASKRRGQTIPTIVTNEDILIISISKDVDKNSRVIWFYFPDPKKVSETKKNQIKEIVADWNLEYKEVKK